MKNQNQKIGSKLVDGHTPTPWMVTIDETGDTEKVFIDSPVASGNEETICIGQIDTNFVDIDEAKANAAFIVRAVNSHEALIAFVRSMLDDEILVCVKEDTGDDGCYHCDAKKLIAQSEKGE